MKALFLPVTVALVLVADAQAQPFTIHLEAAPRLHVGETTTVSVAVMNMGNAFEEVVVEHVSFVMHHGNGGVATSNLLATPADVPCWGEPVVVATTLTAGTSDPDILPVDCVVRGTIDPDGPESLGVPLGFEAQVGVQVVVMKDGPPSLRITPASAGGAALSWSISYEGWRLESGIAGGEWQPVTDSPLIRDGAYTVTVNTADAPHRLFRLSKPTSAEPLPIPSTGR